MRLLLVEDEDELAAALIAALVARDFVVDRVGTVEEAHEAIRQVGYRAVVLDRRLPDGDGLTLLATLRRLPAAPPVLVLTALEGVEQTVSGLDAGADDYLAKPFEVAELAARLRALLRRPPTPGRTVIKVAELVYDTAHREATIQGEPLPLPRRELAVLEILVRRAGRVVTREQLDEAVYGFDDEVQPEAIKPHISRLRRRLELREAGVVILALRGIGYMLKPA